MNNYHEVAALQFENAIKHGFATAVVYNNLGRSYGRIKRVHEAEAMLNEAIKLDGKLQAAYYNRAMVEYQVAYSERRCPDTSWIEKALELGPRTADLEIDAAWIFAFAADSCSEVSQADQQQSVGVLRKRTKTRRQSETLR